MGDTTHDHKLSATAIKMVVDAFKNAPYKSPTGAQGISLHVDAGPDSIMNFDTGAKWGELSSARQIAEVANFGTQTAGKYDWTAFDQEKDAEGGFTRSGRKGIFHYCASVHQFATFGNSGLARRAESGSGGNDFIVSLAALGFPTVTDMNQAGTFMHELGHNLGLLHGGLDDVLDKPNYISIMNYLFQFNGIPRTGVATNTLDYSRMVLPTLDENSLDESKGLGSDAAGFGTFRWSAGAGAFIAIADASQAMDWDDDGATTSTTAVYDINGDNPVSGSFENLGTLTSYNDWQILKLKTALIGGGSGAAGGHVMQSEVHEATKADFERQQPLDFTPPTTMAVLSPPANAAGWNNSAVTVGFNAVDDISGVIATFYAVDDDADFTKLEYGTPVTVVGEGTHQVRFYSQDRAQNKESVKTVVIKIDLTPPEAEISYDPHKHEIQVHGTDALSGTFDGLLSPMSVSPTIWRVGSADNAETRVYHITDRAGNYMDLTLQVRSQENEYELNISDVNYSSKRFVFSRSETEQGIQPNTIQFRRVLPGQCCGSPSSTIRDGCGCNEPKCLLGVMQRLTLTADNPARPDSVAGLIQADWDVLHSDSNIRTAIGPLDIVSSSASQTGCEKDGKSGGSRGDKISVVTRACFRVCGLWKLQIKIVRGRITVETDGLVPGSDGKTKAAEMRRSFRPVF
jgi:hypothetical protein